MKKHIPIILLLFCQLLLAQDPYAINYSINEGFPTSTIYAVNQDEKGYLWFSTDVGIVKYDSHKFELYNTDNGLSDNEVFQMKRDFKGRVWVLTLNGKLSFLYKDKIYNESNSNLIKKVSGSGLTVDFYQDDNNCIYFTYRNGEIKILKPNNQVEKLKVEKLSLSGVWKFKNELFVINGSGIYNLSAKKSIEPFAKPSFYKIYHTDFGNYFSDVNTLYKIEKNAFKKIIELPDKPEILNIYIENQNKIWVCARDGLSLVENNQLKRVFFKNYTISSVTKDFEGGYWISTLKNGVIYVPSFAISVDKMGTENQLRLNCIGINNQKEIWVGSDNNNYYTMSPKKSFVKKTAFIGNRKDLITNIRFFDNSTYVVGKLGVTKVDATNKSVQLPFSANDILIQKDQLYVGYSYVYKLPIKDLVHCKGEEFNNKLILNKRANVLSNGKNDEVWIGTNFGLYNYTKKDSIVFWGNKSDKLKTSIEDLFYDENQNTLFVATSSKGIITIKNNLIKNQITSQSGLNSNTCNSIKKISESLYLIGTNNGLNSISFKENNTIEVRNLNAVIGLKNNRINDIECLNDIVYLATENGLLSFDFKNITSKKSSPKCLIVNLKNQNHIINNNFIFPYSKSDISIEYSGISYINQGNLTYYYKLNGKNDTWASSKETQINYKSLSPKKYIFSVYTVDGFGQKSAIKTIKFEITPPFWQKAWFIILSVLLSLALIYLFITNRLKKQQKRFEEEKKTIQMERDKAQLEKQMVELEQKALRLQMNPHFIFNALNTIKGYYSEGDTINASSYISKFSKLLRMLLENTEQLIPLSKEIEMLEIYINLTKIRYKNKFEYKLVVDETLNASEISIPTLLLQPMVENAIIHGLAPKDEKGKLTVSFLKKENQLECIVEDNGIGRAASKRIQKNKEYESKALEITNERLALFNNNTGKSAIEIIDLETNSIPSGTKVIITIPLISIW